MTLKFFNCEYAIFEIATRNMSNLDRVGVDQNEFIKLSGLMKVFRDIEKFRWYQSLDFCEGRGVTQSLKNDSAESRKTMREILRNLQHVIAERIALVF